MQEVSLPASTMKASVQNHKWPVDSSPSSSSLSPENLFCDSTAPLRDHLLRPMDTEIKPSISSTDITVDSVLASLSHLALNQPSDLNSHGEMTNFLGNMSGHGVGNSNWTMQSGETDYLLNVGQDGYQNQSVLSSLTSGHSGDSAYNLSSLVAQMASAAGKAQLQQQLQRRAIIGSQKSNVSFPPQLQQFLTNSSPPAMPPPSSAQLPPQSLKGWMNPFVPPPSLPGSSNFRAQGQRVGMGQQRTTMHHGRSMSEQNISSSQYSCGPTMARRSNVRITPGVNAAALLARLAQQGRGGNAGAQNLDDLTLSQLDSSGYDLHKMAACGLDAQWLNLLGNASVESSTGGKSVFGMGDMNAAMLDQSGGLLSPASSKLEQHGSTPALDRIECYSRKVFVGGLPPDIDEEEIMAAFRRFGPLVVDWPHKAESKSYFPPKGYCFLLFQEEMSVQVLVDSCISDDGKLYWCVSSPTMKEKPVQIRPWNLADSDFVMNGVTPIDPRKSVFVGGVPRPLRAVELAMIMGRLYGGVCYAGIDTDPELKYPKGAGRVAFSNQQSYIAAISARFVQLQHGDIDKRVEVKPYVLDDQICDECQGTHSGGKYAPYFCANVMCLQYYCDNCWGVIHSTPGREFHKPLVKEGADRPRAMPFRWC